ncbi:lysylphosphatidylglycerol synthase domain-containing protein [Sphingobium sp. EM0848]|uniref:lysylphosphatidylglycerol synthase domain-containing protein n=1 Tax=Sphingobium sp. EM0848 TaxID=2743473 RepID=UPI002101D3F2|nr:lysylphosphatidylglycerol synthase domain-containing protein [Sphingobium sp. EM0848]
MLATVAGLMVAVWTIGATGLKDVLATAGRMGLTGFLAYCLWSLGVFFLLGAAWLAAAPGEQGRSLPLFAWARMVREAVSDLLPFSQLGGIIVSTRTLTAAALPSSRVHGSLVVDLTTEMASQLVYTLFGLALMGSLLIGDGAAVHLRPAILGGTLVMVVIILLFFTMQRAALDFATRMAGRFLPGSTAMAGMRSELARIYTRKDRVALAFGANLVAWVASGIGAWLALRWMGTHASVWDILALESLIFTLRSIAFVIPGALGVQEVAYAFAGPLFGLPPETALALSLAKRARDMAIGLPTLLLWQINEMRHMAGQGEQAL